TAHPARPITSTPHAGRVVGSRVRGVRIESSRPRVFPWRRFVSTDPTRTLSPEQRLQEILAACKAARAAGKVINLEKLIALHPDLADQLRALLAPKPPAEQTPTRAPAATPPPEEQKLTKAPAAARGKPATQPDPSAAAGGVTLSRVVPSGKPATARPTDATLSSDGTGAPAAARRPAAPQGKAFG